MKWALGCWALLIAGTAFAGDAYDESILDGNYRAQDVFVLRGGTGEIATGTRDFDGVERMSSIVSFATRTPIDYAVSGDGEITWSAGNFLPGKAGSIGIGGDVAFYAPTVAAGVDSQVSEGYAALRLGFAEGSGIADADFKGSYSYHALLFKDKKWWNSFGGALASGTGALRLLRGTSEAFDQLYNISTDGSLEIGGSAGKFATLFADGDLAVQLPQVGAGEDALYTGGYDGLAFYVRRGTTSAPFDPNDFQGSYNVIELRVKPSGGSITKLGRITAGIGGRFYGTLASAEFNGRASFFESGVFTLSNLSDADATMGAGGDFAVLTKKNGSMPGTTGEAYMQIWLRTAGGAGTARDADGDGVADATERTRGTNPQNRDSDSDGLLDNVDTKPTTADNVFTAVLSETELDLVANAPNPDPLTLTLDAKDFPFFTWSIADDADWVQVVPASGEGDAAVQVRLSTSSLPAQAQPYEALLRITAPGMKTIAPVLLSVSVAPDEIGLRVTPAEVPFAMSVGGPLPPSQKVRVEATQSTTFAWSAATSTPWLSLAPTSGTGPGDITLSIKPNTLTASGTAYTGSLSVSTGADEEAVGTILLRVYPNREPGATFTLIDSSAPPARPALVLTEDEAVVVVSDNENCYAQAFDDRALPRGALLRLDGPLAARVGRCAATLNPSTRNVLVLWEEALNGASGKYITARELNVDTLDAGNSFVIATGGVEATFPAVAFDAARARYAMAFVGEDLGVRRLRAGLFTASGMRTVAFQDVALDNAIDSDVVAPTVAFNPATGDALLCWRNTRVDEPDLGLGTIHARLLRADGTFAGDSVTLSTGQIIPSDPEVTFDVQGGRWLVVWGETTVASPSVTRTQVLSLPPDLNALGTNTRRAGLSIPSATGQSVAITYSAQGRRALAGIVDTSDRLQYVFLGSQLNITLGPEPVAVNAGQSAPAAATTLDGALHWLAWLEGGDVRALRLAPENSDSDADGLDDDWEQQYGLDANSASGENGGTGDPDADGANNLDEQRMGTDPKNADSDGDGLIDPQEDTDRDGVLDAGESSPALGDTDGDGASDRAERFLGTDPAAASNKPGAGIYAVDYGAFRPGIASTVTVRVYAPEPGDYRLNLNSGTGNGWVAPPGWSAPEPAESFAALPSGDHAYDITVTPSQDIDTTLDHGTFAFRFDAAETESLRTLTLVCDLRSSSGLDASVERSLTEQFAPLLRMHLGERFLPAPVSLSTTLGTLRPATGITLPQSMNTFALGQQRQAEAVLDLPGTDVAALAAAAAAAAPQHPATIYYTVCDLAGPTGAETPAPPGRAIQYYIHYFADEWGEKTPDGHRHEGDWELFQVTLNANNAPQVVTLGQQLELARAGRGPGASATEWANVERVDGHPVLYAGGGGHALYFTPGAQRHEGTLDSHDGLGPWMLPRLGEGEAPLATTWDNVAPYGLTRLPRLYEADAPAWLGYAGRFGQRDFAALAIDQPAPGAQDGGQGPAFIGSPSVWTDPFAWQSRAPAATLPQAANVTGHIVDAETGFVVALFDARGRVFRAPLDENDRFALSVPAGAYWMGLTRTDADAREHLVQVAYADSGEGRTPLFTAVAGDLDDWGEFLTEEGTLHGVANLTETDHDIDSISDAEDLDIDGDGLSTANDKDIYGDGWEDTFQFADPDTDGIPNYYDDNDDGDTLPDALDADRDGDARPDDQEAPDTDGDGVADAYDLDYDNDGYDNATEIAAGTDPFLRYDSPARRMGDVDGDGEVDTADAQLIINAALGRSALTVWMDANEDGRVQAYDIADCLRTILDARGK